MLLEFDEETHTYTLGGKIVPSVTDILVANNFVETGFYTPQGTERGRAVHQACHFLDEDDLSWDTLPEEIKGYVKAYEKFRIDTGFLPTMIEEKVFTTLYEYAGTLDRVGTFANQNVAIIDIKTGTPDAWAGLQLAAYSICLGKRLPRYALKLNENGTYFLKKYEDSSDYEVFLSSVAVLKWRMNHGKYRRRQRDSAQSTQSGIFDYNFG